jgi:hypothetical protein
LQFAPDKSVNWLLVARGMPNDILRFGNNPVPQFTPALRIAGERALDFTSRLVSS